MRRQEEGFTLIELVIVLVILGILAAVAVPQFYNATADAEAAAVGGGRAAVASAIAIQAARLKAGPTGNQVAGELGATCTAPGVIQIAGSSTNGVKVTLNGACTVTATGITGAVYTAL